MIRNGLRNRGSNLQNVYIKIWFIGKEMIKINIRIARRFCKIIYCGFSYSLFCELNIEFSRSGETEENGQEDEPKQNHNGVELLKIIFTVSNTVKLGKKKLNCIVHF